MGNYDIINDEEKKAIVSYLIKEVQIYPHDEAEQPLKSIEFNFPVYRDGHEIRRLLWEKGNTVETVVLMSRPLTEHEKYGEYFMNRSVSDIMSEYSDQHDEWY